MMATCLDIAGAEYPEVFNGREILPLEGTSLAPIFEDAPNHKEALFWEHEGNCAVRQGRWKLVCKYPGAWELYDIEADRSEVNDLSGAHPDLVRALSALHAEWAKRCGVAPWERVLGKRRRS